VDNGCTPSPESAALQLLRLEGWDGSACEGGAILLLLKSACFEYLVRVNSYGSREDTIRRYTEAQFTIHKNEAAEIVGTIQGAKRRDVLQNFAEIYADRFISSVYPGISEEFMGALFDSISPKLSAIASAFLEDSYQYRAGWPDLTLIRNDALRFVEVKTTDTLHASQVTILRRFAEPLDLNFSVLKLSPI
jgi:hypothetical protein